MAGEDGRPSGWRKLRSQRVASQVPPLENCQGPCMENMEHVENRLNWQSAPTRGIWLTVLEKWCTRTLGEDIRDKILQYFNESLLFEALLSSTPESYNLMHCMRKTSQNHCLRMTLWMVWLAWCNPAAWVLSNPTAFWHSGPKMCWPWVEKVSRGDPTWWPGNGKTQEVRFFLIYFPYIFTIFHCDGNVFSIQFQCILHFLILLDEEGCWRMSLAVSG